MNNAIIATIAIAALCSAAPAAAQNSHKLTAGKATEYGLIYSLPMTVVDITIEAEHTLKEPGEFYNYARKNLSISDAITAPQRSATIKSITVVPRGVPNPQSQWVAQFKAGATPYMLLDAAGIPLAINTEDIGDNARAQALPTPKAAEPTPLETEAARQAITQEMTLSSSLSKRAELAAQRVFELREMRSDLLSGEATNTPPDGKSMQLMLDNISAQEAALTAMFAGTTKTYTTVSTITFEPDSTEVSGEIIARLSPVDGFVAADDLSGAPITLSMTILDAGMLPVNDKGEPKRFPKGGVAYNVPGTALITITYDGKTIASQEVALAQLGVTFGLDPDLFTDKKAPSKLILDQTTGAILKLGPAD